MIKMSKYLFLLLFFLMFLRLDSQSLVGTQSNYSGSRSLSVSPSLIVSSNLYFDFALTNIGASAFNDFAYIKSGDMFTMLFSKNHTIPVYEVDGHRYNFLVYDNYKNKNVYESLDLNLFSFMYNLDGKNAFAFSLNKRIYSSILDVPYELLDMCAFGLSEKSFGKYNFSNVSLSSLAWSEFALTYSNKIYEYSRYRVDVGVSIKYLQAYSAIDTKVNNVDYSILMTDALVIDNLDVDMAYCVPINYNEPFSLNEINNDLMVRGNGFSVDFGLTYTYRKNEFRRKKILAPCMIPKVDYLWRVTASLMDLGFINMKNNAVDNTFVMNEEYYFNADDFADIATVADVMETLNVICYKDTARSVVSEKFKMGLPTTLRLQYDYNLQDGFYLNATLVQPLKFFKYSVKASPLLMIEPRYESDFFEIALPLSMRNYDSFMIGASARFAFITVGTHNIASYLGIGNTDGLDFYVSLKFDLFKESCTDRFDACWSIENVKKRNK